MALVSVIKYEGDNSTFVWKYPKEDFSTMSQLIVHETQEAVFFNNGRALDLFGPGRYTLETQNIPLLRGVLNLPTGGRTPFHCEIYFINTTQQMAIKWGCDSQVQYLDPTFNIPLQIGLRGEMTLRVSESRKLLVKIVGTDKVLLQKDLVAKFRALLNSTIKPYVASVMQNGKFSIFEVDSHMNEFSNELHEMLKGDFEEYGLDLVHFYVTDMVKPDDDPTYQHFKELYARQYMDVAEAKLKQQVSVIESQTEAQKMVIESEALAKKRMTEGYTYGQERGFDVAEKIAENEAAGQYANLGVGLGVMTGIGSSVGSQVGSVVGTSINNITDTVKQENSSESVDEMVLFQKKIQKLKMLKDAGLLSDEEFNAQKAQLLSEI